MYLFLRFVYFALLTLVLTSPVSGQDQQTKTRITKSIDERVSVINGFEKKNPKRLKIFEAIESKSGVNILQLKEMPGVVPEGSIFMVYVLHDENEKIIKHEVEPTSESGDWAASFTHYFDNEGRTILFEFYSGSFNSGCADVLKIRRKYYYDENFKLVKKTETYSDKDGTQVKNIKQCNTYGIQREEPKIYKSYKDIEAAISKSLRPYIQ